jgi:hypothetical protein
MSVTSQTLRRAYIATSSFHEHIFNYVPENGKLKKPMLIPILGGTPESCPAGRILHETGRKLYPGINVGIRTPLVAVYDGVSRFTGFIDPNSPIFNVYTTEANYFTPNAAAIVEPKTEPIVPALNSSGLFLYPELYLPGFNQVKYVNIYNSADVFINPYLATMFEVDITPTEVFLTTLHFYLRAATSPTVDLVPPSGHIVTLILSNMGSNTLVVDFNSGSTNGFYGAPMTITAKQVVTMSFAMDGIDAYQIGPARGVTGPMGPRGVMGPIGGHGPTGPHGLPGLATNTGATGPMGPIGPIGPQGVDGAASLTGATGPVGPTGLEGPQGIPGSAMATGATGPAGPFYQTAHGLFDEKPTKGLYPGLFYYATDLEVLLLWTGGSGVNGWSIIETLPL